METKDYLSRKIMGKVKDAAPASRENIEYFQRLSATALDVGTAEVDSLRAQLNAIVLASTVGSLTTIGYQNALANVRYLATKALDRS